MRALGRDHWQRADELPLSRLQGPRRTHLRDQRAEVAPGLVRALDGPPGVGCGLELPSCAVWAGAMLNFAITEFSEVARRASGSGIMLLVERGGLLLESRSERRTLYVCP